MGFIDWEFLAKGLAATGDQVSRTILSEWERQKDEAENVRNMKRKHDYAMMEFEQTEAQRKADEIEIAKEKAKIQEQYERQNIEYKEGMDAALGSSGLLQKITADLTSLDPMRQTMSVGMLQAVNKFKSNEKLTPQDDILIAQYTEMDPIAQSTMAGIKMSNAKFNLEQKLTIAHENYYNSMGDQVKLRGKTQFTDNDLRGVTKDILENEASMQSVMDDDNFRMISKSADEIKKKYAGQDPALIDQMLRQGLGPTDYNIMQNGLIRLQNLQESNEYLTQLKTYVAQNMGYPQKVTQPQPEQQPTPQPEATVQEKQPGLIEQLFGKVKQVAKETYVEKPKAAKAERSIKDVRKKFNIPSNVTIHYAKDAENLQKLKKLPNAEGSYVWFDGELFRLERRKKVLGLVKVTK